MLNNDACTPLELLKTPRVVDNRKNVPSLHVGAAMVGWLNYG